MEDTLRELEAALQNRFQSDCSGHDLHHLKRVVNAALHIQRKEGGDRTVIAVAALLHDVHRIIQNETGRFCSPADSLPQVRDLLDTTTLSHRSKEHVLRCVEFHEEYGFSENGKSAQDLETLILQDADNLDAIGAIGIARTFMFGGVYGVPMWEPELPFDRVHYDESIQDPSVIHHFYSKLLRLRDNMHTETARQMADERHRYTERFIQEFFEEWDGRK